MTSMLENKKTLLVAAIEHGTVIDHIESGEALRLIELLKIGKLNTRVTVGLSLPSSRMGEKDLIKLEGKELTPQETSYIAIFSPRTTITIIKDYEVIDKFTVRLPNEIKGILCCPNPLCVTRHEPIETLFLVEKCKKHSLLKCRYCEKTYKNCETLLGKK